MTILLPDALLDDAGIRRGHAVEIEDGGIVAVSAAPTEGAQRLDRIALAPGFVNAHSHAFQRELRGRVERPGDFWDWRELMYAAAAALDADSIHEVSRSCFRQMRRAGYTSVREFHYVHHRPDGEPYDEPNVLAHAVCEAAEAEGMRICLLLTAYERGGASMPPLGTQLRFRDPDVGTFLARVEALAAWAGPRPLVTVGVAAHSVRAVSRQWLERIARVGLPLHVHADEQRREIEDCLAEHRLRPIELLAEAGVLGTDTTVVHATHADAHEIELLSASGATVCLCPTTEGNLGDGWPPAEQLAAAGVPLAIGSDSNVRLDPIEELRELETCARRVAQRRHVLDVATLLRAGWGGAGRIEAGAPADLVAIDLDNDALRGVEDSDLAAALVFAGDASAIVRTWVAGC